MKKATILVPVKIDAETFTRFAVFDTLYLKKRWKSPVIFALLMMLFSLISFSQMAKIDGAALLGAVLLLVGLGMPGAYFIHFFLSLRRDIKKYGLQTRKPFYTLTLFDGEGGIQVVAKSGEKAVYEWERIYGVYKGKGCAYLFVTPRRAYLLPDEDVGKNAEALWRIAEKYGKSRAGAR